MARLTLTTHRKFRRLARLLGGQAVARGTLELVWDTAYASGEARIGDALDVEEAAQWQGEAGVCVQALVACGFLDADPDGETFSVHDLFAMRLNMLGGASSASRPANSRLWLVNG